MLARNKIAARLGRTGVIAGPQRFRSLRLGTAAFSAGPLGHPRTVNRSTNFVKHAGVAVRRRTGASLVLDSSVL